MQPTLLLVDDIAENVEILQHILEPRGYQVLVASQGSEALKLASSEQPDLILLDIMMPELDGYEVCRRLRAQAETSDIPVIFISALHGTDWKVKGFDAGSVDYISKPFHIGEVVARVSAHVRLRTAQKELESNNERLRQEIEQRKLAEERLAEANRRLQDLAAEDGLTGIANRRRLDEHLTMSWLQMAREGLPLSIILCDIDFFKLYNDHYGHQAGDAVLRSVAQAVRGALKRPADLAGRYGGEEFLVTLSNTDLAGALVVAEEIQEAVRSLDITHVGSTATGKVSLSMGVTSVVPGSASNLEGLIAIADEALYQAKRSGRARAQSLVAPSERQG